MSGPDDDTIERDDDSAAGQVSEDEVDEELLALAGPPPSLRHGLFLVAVLALSVVMMVWFFPDLRYLLRAVSGPTQLGDAADLYGDELTANTYVAVDGIPMLTRTLEFKEGVQWFALSDTRRKLFPLGGQPHLLIQWSVPDDFKVYRDPAFDPTRPSLPSSFAGHLHRRGDLGRNYEKIWVFYDCLEHYSLRQCKHCIGTRGMDDCRARFTCLEQRSPQECQAILDAPDGRGLTDHPELSDHLAELRLAELRGGAEKLEGYLTARRELVAEARRTLDELATGALTQQLTAEQAELSAKIAEATAAEQAAVEQLGTLGVSPERLRAELGEHRDRIAAITSEINTRKRRAERHKRDLDDLAAGRDDAVDKRLADEHRRLAEGSAHGAADAGVADGGPGPATAEAEQLARLEQDRAALAAGELRARREAAIAESKVRIDQLVADRQGLQTELDRLEELAQQLKDLPRAVRERSDKLAELEDRQAAARSGALKAEQERLIALLAPRLEQLDRAAPELAALRQELADAGPGQAPALAQRFDDLAARIAPPRWVLIDGERPIDKLWVVLVYLVFLVMIGLNLRRLHHFWLQWRA